MTERVAWRRGAEAALRLGRDSPVTLLVIPALFEESNRMRRLTVEVMRRLADRGIGTLLPDLPGQGESLVSLASLSFRDWLDFVEDVGHNMLFSVAIRGGCLLDGICVHRWRLAPESGARLLRDMIRATAFSEGSSASDVEQRVRQGVTRLAGNPVAPELYGALVAAEPAPGGFVSAVEGPRLWRAAEPGEDAHYAAALAAEIAEWTTSCAST